MQFYFSSGRFDLHMLQMLCATCNVASEVSLVHLGYWPGSPNNASYCFDQALFQFWDIMQKKYARVILKCFCEDTGSDFRKERQSMGCLVLTLFILICVN